MKNFATEYLVASTTLTHDPERHPHHIGISLALHAPADTARISGVDRRTALRASAMLLQTVKRRTIRARVDTAHERWHDEATCLTSIKGLIMLRNILSIIVGYIVMAVLVFILMSISYALLGTDGAFKEGTFAVSPAWLTAAIIIGIVAAMGGGIACTLIAQSKYAPPVLAGIVLVASFAWSMPRLVSETPEPAERPAGDIPMNEAISQAEQPKWFLVTTGVTGALGVLLGAAIVPSKRIRR